jgi:hypothetical protein
MSDLARYVATADIRAAVKGHETNLLDALNIDWRRPRAGPHITCPYREHADKNPSWRWDGGRRKAFCTCSTRDVLGVLIGVEGVDFEVAKIRAAELLNRPDLIRERRNEQIRGNCRGIPAEQQCHAEQPMGCRLVDYAATKQLPIQFLRSLGLSEISYFGTPAVRMPYLDRRGAEECEVPVSS